MCWRPASEHGENKHIKLKCGGVAENIVCICVHYSNGVSAKVVGADLQNQPRSTRISL